MKFTPRDYQQEAHDAVIAHWKKTTVPCLVEAATGAGKAIIISMLAPASAAALARSEAIRVEKCEQVTITGTRPATCSSESSIT